MRKRTTLTRMSMKNREIADVSEKHRDQQIILRNQIEEFTAYLSASDRQIVQGDQLLVDTRDLLSLGILTEADAWDYESELIKIKQDYNEVLWKLILAHLDLRILLGQVLPVAFGEP